MGRVADKVAIVTGGALGIGRASAALLAREGAKVVVTDILVEEGEAAVEEIRKAGGEARFLEHDVTSEEAWRRVVADTVAAHGRLDILVNNAGLGIGGTAEDTMLEDWRKLMAVNLDAVFIGTREAIAAMKVSGGGSIVNLSSIEGLIGDPNLAAYNASKGGVRIFTKSAALHCAKAGHRIRVNSVHPAYIWTPMVENFLKAQGDLESGKRFLESLHPIGHLGEPDDIAYGILYLASDEAKFVTGSELVIDGGYTAQ